MAKTAGSQIKQKPKTNNKSCSQKNTYIYIYTYTANGMGPNKEYIFIYNRPTKVSFFFKLFLVNAAAENGKNGRRIENGGAK